MSVDQNEKLGAQITFRTTENSYRLVEEVMSKEDRRQNETIRRLLDIALYVYFREGKNFIEWKREIEKA